MSEFTNLDPKAPIEGFKTYNEAVKMLEKGGSTYQQQVEAFLVILRFPEGVPDNCSPSAIGLTKELLSDLCKKYPDANWEASGTLMRAGFLTSGC